MSIAIPSHVQVLDGVSAANAMALYQPGLSTRQIFDGVFQAPSMRARLDASTSGILERQLEYVRTQVYKQRYAGLIMQGLIPDPPQATPRGADSIRYYGQDMHGRAEFLANKAGQVPVVGIDAEEATKRIYPFAAKFTWTLMDMERAAFAGVPLASDKAMACRRAVEQLLDEVLAVGTANLPLEGLFSLTGVTVDNTPATAWASETFDNILAQLLSMEKAVYDRNNGMVPASGFRLVLASDDWSTCLTKIDTTGSEKINVLEQFLRNSQLVTQIDKHYRLNGAGTGGDNRQVLYPINDPLVCEKQIPITPEFLPVHQVDSMHFEQVMIASTGGVITRDATQIQYLDVPA